MNLAKRTPRSPYNVGVFGVMNLARMTDKAIARLSDSIGQYNFGSSSNRDCRTLSTLGLTEKDFLNIVESALYNSSAKCRISNSFVSNKLRFQTDLSLKKNKRF